MADEAINYMKQLNAAAPEKPFFLCGSAPLWLFKFL
jgi:hypothetical protein